MEAALELEAGQVENGPAFCFYQLETGEDVSQAVGGIHVHVLTLWLAGDN